MFLPDGRVLIMDLEKYKETIKNSIVLDLFEGGISEKQSGQPQEENKVQEDKQRIQKEKKVQVNQRKRVGHQSNLNSEVDQQPGEDQEYQQPYIIKRQEVG